MRGTIFQKGALITVSTGGWPCPAFGTDGGFKDDVFKGQIISKGYVKGGGVDIDTWTGIPFTDPTDSLNVGGLNLSFANQIVYKITERSFIRADIKKKVVE